MASDKFRQQLRQEAEQWRAEGLIDQAQFEQLAERYQFQSLDTVARDRFIAVVLGLGSVLVGLGAITFVAANWQAISQEVKMLLLMGLFLGVNGLGFLWYQKPRSPDGREHWQNRLGQGLLLLGALILGANLTLMGQLFHSSGTAAELCLVWGLAVLAMAYSIRLTSLGVLAVLLMGIGYWNGVTQLADLGMLPGLEWMVRYMPIVSAFLFLPLAYCCRSRGIFTLGAIAVLTSLEVVLGSFTDRLSAAPGLLAVLIFTLPPALLWSYEDGFLRPAQNSEDAESFAPLSRSLAVLFLTVLLYLMSYHYAWDTDRSAQSSQMVGVGLSFLWNLNVLGFAGITLVQWISLARPTTRSLRWGLSRADGLMALLLLLLAILTFWHYSITPIQGLGTLVCNLLLFMLAIRFLQEGLAEGQRNLFWSGMILLTLQILSRTLEYDTGLLLKSLTFLLCGIAVITIGLWFERYVRTLRRAE
ncbi:MAG TPA: DUF2157 domain-containing protein [Trichocoleus sp.]|jgi:uncharacterized membrane protein